VGEYDDALVYELSCEGKGDQRLFGMSRLKHGMLEGWNNGMLGKKWKNKSLTYFL
jgi:hypothetical protein